VCRPLPMILANISSLITLPALSVGFFEQKYYGSNVPPAPTNLYIHPVVTSCVINCLVMLSTNAILPEGVANAFNAKSEKEALTFETITSIMSGTVETVYSPLGRLSYFLIFMFSVPACPWYGKAFNGCDKVTYGEHNEWILDNSLPKPPDCDPEGPSPCGSFAKFGGAEMGSFIFCFPISSMAQFAWKPDPNAGAVITDAK